MNAKTGRSAGFIQVIGLAAALFLAAGGLPLPAHAGGDDLKICLEIFDPMLANGITKVQIELAFHAIQMQEETWGFSQADRILLKTARGPWDREILKLLSPDGLQKLEALASRQERVWRVIKQQTGVALTEAQIQASTTVDRMHPLRRMLDARDAKKWDEMIRIYEQDCTEAEKKYPFIRQQLAFAYNRRADVFPQDRDKAIQIAKEVLAEAEKSGQFAVYSEGAGILGRMYKDLYEKTGDKTLLHQSVDTYESGIIKDHRNYYPGYAGLELMWANASEFKQERMDRLTAMVVSALRRSLVTDPDNIWTVQTAFKMLLKERLWTEVFDVLPKIFRLSSAMSLDTAIKGLERMIKTWKSDPATTKHDLDQIEAVHAKMSAKLTEKENEILHELSIESPKEKFPDTEGVIRIQPLVLKDEADRAEILRDLTPEIEKSVRQVSIHKHLQIYQPDKVKEPGVLLGATGEYDEAIEALAERTGNVSWKKTYSEFKIPRRPENTPRFLAKLAESGRHVVYLIPPHFHTKFDGTISMEEYRKLIHDPTLYTGGIELVYGFYDFFGIDVIPGLTQGRPRGYSQLFSRGMIGAAQDYFIRLGPAIKW